MTSKRRTRMNKTLISIEGLKRIALREIYTYPGCEDVSAVSIYPVTGEWSKAIGLHKFRHDLIR
jgi:hypothetical protein